MSTAGKVLTVLVLLVVPIWIILVAGVAQLNTEWTQVLEKQKTQIEKLEKDVQDNDRAIHELKGDVELAQRSAEQEETNLRAKLAEVERARADTIQSQTGVNIQLETVQAALKNAEVAKSQRASEKEAETKAKKAAEAAVAKLKSDNSDLMDQLATLRKEFKSNLEEARKLIDRAQKPASAKPARRTSLVR